MFKQFRDGIKAAQVNNSLNNATAALNIGRLESVEGHLEKAYRLCLDTTFPRMILLNLMTTWGLFGIELRKLGYEVWADNCERMSSLLEAKNKAGDYYRE